MARDCLGSDMSRTGKAHRDTDQKVRFSAQASLLKPHSNFVKSRIPLFRSVLDGWLVMRILILEDDPLIAMVMEDQVSALGYEAICVDTQAAARPYLGQVDVLISDLAVRDGLAHGFLHELRADHPTLPVIIATGYQPDGQVLPKGPTLVLGKPYSGDELRQAFETINMMKPA